MTNCVQTLEPEWPTRYRLRKMLFDTLSEFGENLGRGPSAGVYTRIPVVGVMAMVRWFANNGRLVAKWHTFWSTADYQGAIAFLSAVGV